MRKLLSLLLVVVMLFGLATTALAYTDVTATTQTGPVEKLSALGIIKGYADGTFKPENPITRAEFAAVIVRAMGLEEAAKLINTPTKFSDVTANYAWAYGYINIASAKGIIKGDPDGKFRPGDKVSFAEAITMLLRAGGWDAACSTMDWPAGFVMKAVEFGLTDDVSFDANTPANRGAVAVMTYNALSMPMARWNDTSKVYDNDQSTLANRYLNAYEKTIVVTSVPSINGSLKANQIVTADGTMYVPTGVDPNAFLGREVRVIKVSNTYVFISDVTPAARIITGMGYVDGDSDEIAYTDGDDTFEKNVVDDAVYILNNSPAAYDDLNDDCTLTLFLDADGDVRFVIANEWDHEQYIVVAKSVKGVDGATSNSFKADCGCTFPVLANTVFVKNGKAATFADLTVGDVFYAQANSSDQATYVELYSNNISGKVSAVALNAKGEAVLTVNGTNYVVDNEAFDRDYVTRDEDILDKTEIGGLVNFDATIKLNAIGKAIVVSGATTALIGKVTAIDDANDKITVSVKGVSNTYVHLATCETVADQLDEGYYVAMTQRADGKITYIEYFELDGSYTVKAVDTVNKKLTLADGSDLFILKYAASTFGVRLGTWGDANLLKAGDEIAFFCPDETILYFEVNPSFAGHIYGKYIGMTSIEGTTYIYVNVKGEVKTYESEVTPVAGLNLVDVSLDSMGVATAVNALAFEGSPDYVFEVKAGSGNVLTVERLSDHQIQVHDLSSAIIYKADGSLGTMADLTAGELYLRAMNDTKVVVIQIIDPV